MKSSEKRLLYLATLSISILFVIATIFLYMINISLFTLSFKIVSFIFICMFFSFIIYLTINYLLSPMFKTNYLLELLLKDTLHELNIPLSVIKANLQMLRLDEKNEIKLKRLHRVDHACADLRRLYNDMDYYIKKEVKYDVKEEFDVKEVVEYELNKVKDLHLQVKISFDVDSLHVRADKHGFSKILSNLFDNAIKYNNNDKNITVELKNAKLSIIDNGIGMDQSELFKVFDRYYQEDSTKNGAGIGLNIVKTYCDEEKIFINILSQKGSGTKVTLDFKNILIRK